MIKFPFLTADDIECRVSQINDKGLSLLLYKDARCDMRILDATVGTENWQREHYECKGNLFCRVGIKCDDVWVFKSDCGTESNTEKEKGEASDSFKRACFNWGIGRELYTAPFIWVKSDQYTVSDRNGKPTTYDRFKCTYMRVEGGKIVALNIENAKTRRTIYVFGDVLPETNKSAQTDLIICEACGKPITDYTTPRNRFITAAQLAKETQKEYGKCMCSDCSKAAKNARA